jgi:paraquat-inducible protein B
MAAEKSYARLGLFIIVAIAVILATGLFFVQRMKTRQVITMYTYVNENVTGLDISSPVRYRGVSVGRVSALRVDQFGDTIEIEFEVLHDRLEAIGSNVKRVQQMADLPVFPNLRARLVSNPLTGEAYLLLDMPEAPPPPLTLAFTPKRPYVASMPSPMAVVRDRLPEVLERAEETLNTVREIIQRVPASLDRSDRFFTTVEQLVRESELPQFTANTQKFFATTSEQFAQISNDMDRLLGTGGSLVKLAEEARAAVEAADLPGSTQAARDAMDRTSLAADELRRALPGIRDSLGQLRELARRIDEQPESVVYGPRPPAKEKP